MPHVSVDLVLEDSPADLLMREAEIAVRMFRPHQVDLITRPCGAHVYGFFASPGYLARRGHPREVEELRDHDLIGYDRRTAWLENAARLGFTFTRDDFVTRTDSEPMHPRLAAAGLGVAAISTWVGEQLGLTRLLPGLELAGQPVFLVAHQSSRQNPRVARVWRHLGDALDARFGGTKVGG
jgi:DNA-binding transcriptional LysR family regulator